MSYSLSEPPACPTTAAELKLYQTFIFSVTIFFTFTFLLLFYLFYLRRRTVDWSSLRIRTSDLSIAGISVLSELGLKKEYREMLPVVVYGHSFLTRETLCPGCLGDYEANDQLQQIPACGHTFHMECIDHWLANNTACPLFWLSLLPPTKITSDQPLDVHRSQSEEIEI